MNENAREYGFHFESSACAQCPGNCCTGPRGYVWLTIDEMEKIAVAIGLPLLDRLPVVIPGALVLGFHCERKSGDQTILPVCFSLVGAPFMSLDRTIVAAFHFGHNQGARRRGCERGCPGVRLGPSSPGFPSASD